MFFLLGAIVGDIVGSIYEFHPIKTTEFPFFRRGCRITDDTVMTVAVAEGLMNTIGCSQSEQREALVRSMQYWGRKYPTAGYGSHFSAWLEETNPRAYHSWGNGAAMRVSAAGWLYPSIEETARHAGITAAVSHDHPEGIKGARATAAAIFMLRNGKHPVEVKTFIENTYGYDLSSTLAEIRPEYTFDVSSQGTMPAAFLSFFESTDFESTIRNAVSLGGDSDTIAAIAGCLAEAYYGIPEEIKATALSYLDDEMVRIYEKFTEMRY